VVLALKNGVPALAVDSVADGGKVSAQALGFGRGRRGAVAARVTARRPATGRWLEANR
jgi:hypothetical protein